MKTKPITVGELIDFLLKQKFSRNDLVVIEQGERELSVNDLGISTGSGGYKLLIGRN